MTSRPFVPAIAALGLLSYQCATTTAPGAGVTIQVATEQVRPGAVAFHLAVRNDGDATVYAASCGGSLALLLDRREGLRWKPYGIGSCEALYRAGALPIPPGATITDPAEFAAGVGVYRVVVRLTTAERPTATRLYSETVTLR